MLRVSRSENWRASASAWSYWVAGLMIKEGLDVYMPLVDDKGIDMVVRREDGTLMEVQVKARSKDVVIGDAALFSSIYSTALA